jgi:hypothetical protein
LGIEEVNFSSDNRANEKLCKFGFTCAAACIAVTVFANFGIKGIPVLKNEFVRQMTCKLLQLASIENPFMPPVTEKPPLFETFLTTFFLCKQFK